MIIMNMKELVINDDAKHNMYENKNIQQTIMIVTIKNHNDDE